MTTQEEDKDMDELSGFIFLCNGKTKPECYIYRVFGLPAVQKEVVEKIKPGMDLFLFDFERKLLYGPYEATSVGKLNLEPAAFGGKFPAQGEICWDFVPGLPGMNLVRKGTCFHLFGDEHKVSFRICKDCFPLPESSFRHAIKDNYHNGKFKQELNHQQVRNLLLLFCPLPLPASTPVPSTMPCASLPLSISLSGMENRFQAQATVPAQNDPYVAGMQLSHNPSVLKSQYVQRTVPSAEYPHYGSLINSHLSMKQQPLPAPMLSSMEDPYVGMQYCHASQVTASQQTGQRILLSQPLSYGSIGSRLYANQTMEPQTLPVPTASYHHPNIQQAYLQGNPSYRYGLVGDIFHNKQNRGSANEHHQLSQSQQKFAMHLGNVARNYTPYLPASAHTEQQHMQFNTQASIAGHAIVNIPVTSHSNGYNTSTHYLPS